MGLIDATIVVGYVAATTLFGIWLGRGQADNRDFFLGGRRLPTWALLISIVATETSTVTFLSVPGLSYVDGGNFTFLEIAIGYIIGRLAIVVWLLPGYFRSETLTAYQRLEQQYGLTTRRLASLVFLVTRNLADGLRLFLTALALNIAVGLNLLTCIVLVTAATAIYSCLGGVRSVVWNDCIQFAIYILGAIVAAVILLAKIPGGWEQLLEFAESSNRFRLFDFDASLTKPGVSFWSGCIGGAFLSLATHGADQLIVQRYLCAKSRSAAAWALSLSGVIVFVQFALFLLIGVALACFYAVHPPPGGVPAKDEALMTFVVQNMGVGIRGLILAAVISAAMSTLSSSLNSSASSLVNDWLGGWLAGVDERRALRLARLLTLGFAAVQAVVAIAAYQRGMDKAIVLSVLEIAGFTTGLLLGLFGLGLIAPRTSERAAIMAFAAGVVVTCWAAFATPLNGLWYTLVGSVTIVVVGLIIGPFLGRGRISSAP
jgi:SSS family transporter